MSLIPSHTIKARAMKNIVVPKETNPIENRVCLLPGDLKKLKELGAEIGIESGIGLGIGISDAEYEEVGGQVFFSKKDLFKWGDIVLRIRRPELEEIEFCRTNSVSISFLDPFHNLKLISDFQKKQISAISMEMIPRITTSQSMDALSSQASLAGYAAVILASERLEKILPMMMTPAGTLSPSNVFIIGAGVAGLQAIATAKRLGARVEAFDTRPIVEEQVKSLGAKFVKINLGETGQTKSGYAKALTSEQLQKQREVMAKHLETSDIVITTAQLFGRKAPVIIMDDMIKRMKKGSIIIDLAAETGGNVEGSKPGEEIKIHNTLVIGAANMAGRVPFHASQMYSSNITNLLIAFWDSEEKCLNLNKDNPILQGCLITHQGVVVNETIKNLMEEKR